MDDFNLSIATTPIVDSHVHFWKYEAESVDFSWIDDSMKILKQDFLPEDFPMNFPVSEHHRCIAVQASESMEETIFLLAHAASNPMIAGVVGWVDWTQRDIKKQYANLRKFEKLKGFRHIIQDQPEGFLRNSTFKNAIAMLGGSYTYDLLIKPPQLSEALELVNEFPKQSFVINHLAKPDIKGQNTGEWAKNIRKFKNKKNVFCKLSGMVTEANWHNWKPQDFKEVLDVTLDTFGTDRLMFGSDWPVCLLASDYQGVYNLVNDFISALPMAEQEKIRYKNAVKFYKL